MVFGMAALVLAKAAAVLTPQVLKHTIDDLTIEVTSEKLAFYASLIVGIAVTEGVFPVLDAAASDRRFAPRRV